MRDLLDPFRLLVGGTTGGGVRVNAAGLAHTGVNIGIKPGASSFGLKYGRGYFILPESNWLRYDADQSLVVWNTTVLGADFTKAEFDLARSSFALMPILFSWIDATDPTAAEWRVPEEGVAIDQAHWIWSGWAWENARFGMIHALDVEVELGLLVYADVGFSPGELVDFVVGFSTIDLAGDDRE